MPAFVELSQRFWYKVLPNDETGCWEWQGAKDANGYARVSANRQNVPAYRVAYQLCRGDIPDKMGGKRAHLMHHCDNPVCVNPWHLSVGSALENARDMIAKGRAKHPPMRPDVTKCRSGRHDWIPENVYTKKRKDRPQTDRTCKRCAAERASKTWRSSVLDG